MVVLTCLTVLLVSPRQQGLRRLGDQVRGGADAAARGEDGLPPGRPEVRAGHDAAGIAIFNVIVIVIVIPITVVVILIAVVAATAVAVAAAIEVRQITRQLRRPVMPDGPAPEHAL
ncbi:hypothetical protein MAPG_09648 [Magnaporthiopsis poae ATCC 64411]|uniref:Uncharacterized protein n=1 Tax=Magnaporthiopsis poae (strain ATCC 64411 / 73-15) TaxID=644358 RepID=A0A0C4EAH7_MAGP6|nr:hypothetical protein MAPG_09648 [Magnaporthiopsis poae ATCC 64411]